jgi:hypothetical protein
MRTSRQLIVGNAVGKTGASFVERDKARERRKPAKESRVVGFLPAQFQMRHPARDIDQIERSVADDLVGDVHLAASGEASLRDHLDTLCGKL